MARIEEAAESALESTHHRFSFLFSDPEVNAHSAPSLRPGETAPPSQIDRATLWPLQRHLLGQVELAGHGPDGVAVLTITRFIPCTGGLRNRTSTRQRALQPIWTAEG